MIRLERGNTIILLALVLMLCWACKKKSIEPLDIYDDSNFHDQESSVMQDAESLFGGVASFENGFGKCAIHYIDSSVYNTYVVHYNDTTCDGKWIWKGKIEIKLSGKWSDKGTVITTKITNFEKINIAKETSGDENDEIINTTLNGEKIVTNISGGLEDGLQEGDSVIRQVKANNLVLKKVNVTTGNETSFTWNESRIKVIKKVNNVLQFIFLGNGLGNSTSDIVSWGNYNNKTDFYTFIDSPLIYKKCNGKYRFTNGIKITHTKSKVSKISTFTYGVDNLGNPVNDCSAYGYKLMWNNTQGKYGQKIVKY